MVERQRHLLDRDARATLNALYAACSSLGSHVSLVDSAWLPDDETLTAYFVGPRAAVAAVDELARVGFDRITRAVQITG